MFAIKCGWFGFAFVSENFFHEMIVVLKKLIRHTTFYKTQFTNVYVIKSSIIRVVSFGVLLGWDFDD